MVRDIRFCLIFGERQISCFLNSEGQPRFVVLRQVSFMNRRNSYCGMQDKRTSILKYVFQECKCVCKILFRTITVSNDILDAIVNEYLYTHLPLYQFEKVNYVFQEMGEKDNHVLYVFEALIT